MKQKHKECSDPISSTKSTEASLNNMEELEFKYSNIFSKKTSFQPIVIISPINAFQENSHVGIINKICNYFVDIFKENRIFS